MDVCVSCVTRWWRSRSSVSERRWMVAALGALPWLESGDHGEFPGRKSGAHGRWGPSRLPHWPAAETLITWFSARGTSPRPTRICVFHVRPLQQPLVNRSDTLWKLVRTPRIYCLLHAMNRPHLHTHALCVCFKVTCALMDTGNTHARVWRAAWGQGGKGCEQLMT